MKSQGFFQTPQDIMEECVIMGMKVGPRIMDTSQSNPYTARHHLPYLSRHINHRGAPLVTNMDEGKGSEANGSEPPMSLRRLLVGIFPLLGIEGSIAIIAVSIGFILKLVGWL